MEQLQIHEIIARENNLAWWITVCLITSIIEFNLKYRKIGHKSVMFLLFTSGRISTQQLQLSNVASISFYYPTCYLHGNEMGRVKRIWYLSPEPPLLAHTSSESRGTFRQKARSPAPLNGWACAIKICHDGMPEDTNSLDAAQIVLTIRTNCSLIGTRRSHIYVTALIWCHQPVHRIDYTTFVTSPI